MSVIRSQRLLCALSLGVAILATSALAQSPETFQKAKISLQVEGKTKQVEANVKLDQNAFVVTDKKTGVAIKTLPFAQLKGVEYSYAKSPRWKTAIFVSPLFLFTSGKQHWLNVQGDGDYALLQLDKSNYKLILASVEAKSGKKIETVEDSK